MNEQRQNPHFQVAFCTDHRPVALPPSNPTGRSTILHARMPDEPRHFDVRTNAEWQINMTAEQRLAQAYYSLLTRIDWTDELLVNGMREGLNKFLSNAFGSMYPRLSKYHRTHFVSRNALLQLEQGNHVNLVYEHLVPKSQYIQKPCEDHARQKTLTVDLIYEILIKYWKTATITKKEDDTLNRRNMPENWDGVDPFARYRAARIDLGLNPYFPPNHAEPKG